MELQQLRAFAAIADAGGVTRAAARLNLSQPAVSRQVQMLEAALGVRLFLREGRSVRLTPEGEDLLGRSRGVLADADALIERSRELRSGETGLLKIGATPPMIEAVLCRFLGGYHQRHPKVDVQIIEDGGSRLADRLAAGDVHIAYVPAGDDRFAGTLLYPIHVVAVVTATSKFARRRSLEVEELAGVPLLLLDRGFGSRDWFDAACRAAGIRPVARLESASHNVVLGLAAAGYGVGILPSAILAAGDGVACVPLVHRKAPIGQWTMLAWSANRFLAPFAARFADELAAFARANYPGREVTRHAPRLPPPAGSP